MAGTGEYEHFKGQGVFNCAGCGAPLYKTSSKFDSGCGWPAFAEGYVTHFVSLMTSLPGAIKRFEDNSWGMKRIEIVCANCGGHLVNAFEWKLTNDRVMYFREKDIDGRMGKRLMSDTA